MTVVPRRRATGRRRLSFGEELDHQDVVNHTDEALTRYRTPRLGLGAAYALLDQAFFGSAGLAVNILMGRWLPRDEYGAFALAYSFFLLLGAFHTAFLTEPMLVHGPSTYVNRFREYLGLLLIGHAGVSLIGSFLIAGVAWMTWTMSHSTIAAPLWALAISNPFILLAWLSRRAFYALLSPKWATAGSAVYATLAVGGVFLLFWTGTLSAASSVAMMGIAGFIAGLLLILVLRPVIRYDASLLERRAVLLEHWRYGRWSSPAALLAWIPSNLFVLLLAWSGNLSTAGVLRAITNLVLPAFQAIAGVSVLITPWFVKCLLDEGTGRLKQAVGASFAWLGWIAGLYGLFLFVLAHDVLSVIYLGRYDGYEYLVRGIALLPVLTAATAILGGALRARNHPELVFICYGFGSLIALTIGVWLTLTRGAIGAVASMVICGFAIALAMFQHHVRLDAGKGTTLAVSSDTS